MSNKVQKSTSFRPSRSSQRLITYHNIVKLGCPAFVPCRRCALKGLCCVCLEDRCCAECYRSNMGKTCDATGPSRVVRELVEQKAALDKAIEESAEIQSKAAAAAAKVARLSKVVKQLESRSKEEVERVMKELEKDSEEVSGDSVRPAIGGSDGSGDPAVNSFRLDDFSWFDQYVIEADPGSSGGTGV